MENKLKIFGGKQLQGQVSVDASKNAFLPIMAAAVLCDGEVLLDNFVDLTDLHHMCEILNVLGVKTHISGKQLEVDARDARPEKITHELSINLRASIILLGAMLARFKCGVIAYPGGCKIGARPIDIHIDGLRALGAQICERHGYVYCHGQNMKSGEVVLSFPSVGATESLMLCATMLDGVTTIKNCAKEPEIVDLQNFLNKMGGKVFGAGTDCIEIEGVKKLHGCQHTVMPDRIVAGTYLLAVATCGGDVLVDGALAKHNESLVSFLRQSACNVDVFSDKIRVKMDRRPLSIGRIHTLPYPNFPTDLQPQIMVLQSISKGVSIIEENLFENRFGIVPELHKMGAEIVAKDKTACVVGVEKLLGADVFSTDLRAGAALVIAGMKAEGYTTIHNVAYIDRGYEHIEQKFALLGAEIERF